MKAKKAVIITGVSFQIGYALGVAAMVYRNGGAEMIVTSVKDGVHGTDSLHAKGNAADLRTRSLSAEQLGDVLVNLRRELEPIGFDVVDETSKPGSPHIHIEFDPKKGESFLTTVL